MRRMNFFSLIALFIFSTISIDILSAEGGNQEEKKHIVQILNRSCYKVHVYFNKDDAKNCRNLKQLIPTANDCHDWFELDVSQSDMCKVYLKIINHSGHTTLLIPSMSHQKVVINIGSSPGYYPLELFNM